MYSIPGDPSNLKLRLFRLLHDQLKTLQLDRRLYAALLAIEVVQLIAQTVPVGFDFLWPSRTTGYLQMLVRYLDVGVLLNGGSVSVLLILLSITLTYCLLIAGCIVLQLLPDKRAKPTSIQLYSLKLLNILVLGLRTVLALPFWQCIVGGFTCGVLLTEQPSSTVFIVTIVMATLCCLLFAALQGVYTMLLFEISPFEKCSLASPINSNETFKLLLKIFTATYLMLDRNKFIGKYYIISLTVLAGVWCFKNYRQLGHYDAPQKYFSEVQCAVLFWMSLCVFVQAFIAPEEFLGIYFVILGLPLTVLAWLEFKRLKRLSMLCLTYKMIGSADDVIYFVLCMINSVRYLSDTAERIKLEGILTYHMLTCKRASQCSCADMSDYQKRARSPAEDLMWFRFIKDLMVEALERFPKYTRLHILLAYLEHVQLHNKYKALFYLVSAVETNPSLPEQFMIFNLQERIEECMIEEDNRANETRTVDINKFLEFSNRLLDFRVLLEQTVNSYVQFWKALLEGTPNLNKIKTLGSKITGEAERSEDVFGGLCSLNANNLECLEMYASFLANVVNDSAAGEKLEENIKVVRKNLGASKNFSDEERLKYGENSQTGIIVISGNLHNLGIIVHCNTQVRNILDYYMSDLIGQNINRVMPKVIGDHHDESLKAYLDTSQERLNGNERFAPMINKEGFLVPCNVLTKPLPNLDEGIKIVGFFRMVTTEHLSVEVNNPHYVLFREDTEEVQGLSENIFKNFGIRKMKELSTTQLNNEITLKSMFNVTLAELLDEQTNQSGKTVFCNRQRQQNQIDVSALNKSALVKQEVIVYNHTRLVYRGVPLCLIYFLNRKINRLPINKQITQGQASRASSREHIDIQQIEVQVDEEAKLLTDFKLMTEDKNEPLSIRTLKKLGSLSFLVMIGLAATGLVFFDQRRQQIEEGQTAILLGGRLMGHISETNYYSRKMQLDGVSPSVSTSFVWWPQNLTNTVNQLQNDQFAMVKLQINATNRGAKFPLNSMKYIMGQNGTPDRKNDTLDLTLFDYITSASGLQSASPADLNFTLSDDAVHSPSKQYINFYNIRYTGLFSLLQDEQRNLQSLHYFYRWYIKDGQVEFVVLLGVSLAIIVIALVAAIPFVISVVRISNRVLSLFGYIQLASIEELIKNCQVYTDNFLKDTVTGRLRIKQEIKAAEIATEKALTSRLADEEQAEVPSDAPDEAEPVINTSKKMADIEQERCQALMQTRDHTSIRVILQYSLFSLVFATYFISDYFITRGFLASTQTNYDVALCLANNLNTVKQLKVVTLESMIDNGGFDGRQLLSDSVVALGSSMYLSQRQLNDYKSQNFHPAFTAFFFTRDLYNADNLCAYIGSYSTASEWYPSDSFTQQDCYGNAQGILSMGLGPSLIGYVQTSSLIYNASLTDNINGSSFALMQSMQKYLEAPLFSLSGIFSAAFTETLALTKQMVSIKFAVFVILLLVLFVFAWLPFLRELNAKIWMTKGMLNMIPLRLVSQNEKLKEQLISGNILSSVK